MGFLDSLALGVRYEGDLFLGGPDFPGRRLPVSPQLNRTRRQIAVQDSALEDKVADNLNTKKKKGPFNEALQ
jgi:hypothetical protein